MTSVRSNIWKESEGGKRGREGGKKNRRKGGREEGRKEGREGGRKEGRKGIHICVYCVCMSMCFGVFVNREKFHKDPELITVATLDVSLGLVGRGRGRIFTTYPIHFCSSRIFCTYYYVSYQY